MNLGFEFKRTAAKPKGESLDAAPVQEPMKADRAVLRRKPSTDQKKVRRQMSKKATLEDGFIEGDQVLIDGEQVTYVGKDWLGRQAPPGQVWVEWGGDPTLVYDDEITPYVTVTASKENPMSRQREAELLQAMAKADLPEQRRLALELDALRRSASTQVQAERDLDLADTVIRDTLTPVRVHEHHTASTDWLDEVVTSSADYDHAMRTEATMWFSKVHEAVKADEEEFSEQAKGMARRMAGRYGEQAEAAAQAFLDTVVRLRSQAAGDSPGKVNHEQSGNSESTVTDYDTKADQDPLYAEDWDDTGDAGHHPPMPGAGEGPQSLDTPTASRTAALPTFEEQPYLHSRLIELDAQYQQAFKENDLAWLDDIRQERQELHEALESASTTASRRTAGEVPENFKESDPGAKDCTACEGKGNVPDGEGDIKDCDACDGSGEAKDIDTAKESQRKTAARSLSEIARDIRKEWGSNVNFAAKPYLDAMMSLDSITDMYGADSAKSIVAYFLSNASSFRGERAKELKAELKALQKGASKTAGKQATNPQSGHAESELPTPENDPRIMWPVELVEEVQTGEDAAEGGTPTPSAAGGYPQPKRSHRVVAVEKGDKVRLTEDDHDPDMDITIPAGTEVTVAEVDSGDADGTKWLYTSYNGEDVVVDPSKVEKVSARKQAASDGFIMGYVEGYSQGAWEGRSTQGNPYVDGSEAAAGYQAAREDIKAGNPPAYTNGDAADVMMDLEDEDPALTFGASVIPVQGRTADFAARVQAGIQALAESDDY